jgi:glutamate-1-semialdehyde 2,1-aminomutase
MSGPRAFIERADGAWLWDISGRDYLDYLLGQGPNFLGHAPKSVVDAVADSCRQGVIFGGQHSLEVEATEALLRALRWPEMARFGLTGTEMVQAALRLARAYTGRRLVVRFEGHYHGWLDNLLIAATSSGWGPASAGQMAPHLEDFLILPFNNVEALDECFRQRGQDIACILAEPIMFNSGAIVPLHGYLDRLRETADAYGSLLIFDEVITGFRVAKGGAADVFGVLPDLAIYGKAMAGGFPASALAGSARIMERLAIDTNHSGTFNGNVMSTAATLATMEVLGSDPPYSRIAEHGTGLMKGIGEVASRLGVQINVQGVPSGFHVGFGKGPVNEWRDLKRLDSSQYAQFAEVAVSNGLWLAGRGIWYTSAAHGPAELATALQRFESTLSTWVEGRMSASLRV